MELNNNNKFGIAYIMCMLLAAYMIDWNALVATVMVMLTVIVACIIRR